MRSTTAIFSAALALTACDGSKDSGQTARHAIGKADLAGSCRLDDCGDQSAGGNCWCDSACEAFGDCCENAAFVCEAPAPSCDDDSTHSPLCDTPPLCDEGQVKALKNGCFACVDPQTCEAPPPSCDDDSTHSPLCDVPPVCDAGQVKALKNGCFVCVDPQTCEAPTLAVCNAPACDVDGPSCAAGTLCLVVGDCANPVCTTLATACEALGCSGESCGTTESFPATATCSTPE